MPVRAFLGVAGSGSVLAVALVACSSFTAAERPSAPDAAEPVDATVAPVEAGPLLEPLDEGCVRSTFEVGDAGGDTQLAPAAMGGGLISRGEGGLVFSATTGAAGVQAYGSFHVPDRETVTRLVVAGRLSVAAIVPDRPWSPIAIFASDAPANGGADVSTGTVLVSLGDGVGDRARTTFAPPGAVPTILLSSGPVGSFPSRTPLDFRLTVAGRWYEAVDVTLSSGGQRSVPVVPTAVPRVDVMPTSRSALDVTIGMVYPPEGGASLTLYELVVDVCRTP